MTAPKNTFGGRAGPPVGHPAAARSTLHGLQFRSPTSIHGTRAAVTLSTPELSAVVPAYDEIENLPVLLGELRSALSATGKSYEIVLVDDGSKDGSQAWLLAEAQRDPCLAPVLLEKNVGQSGALAAGLSRARGAIVVTLDADLQNDPADLPRLLAALENADVVSGIRTNRQDTWMRLVSSRIANATRRAVLGDPVTDIGCSFKAYRREALEGLPFFTGAHRFLPAMCVFRGARFAEVPLAHRARRYGVSKYGLHNRLWRGLYDLVGVRWLKTRLLRYRIREVPR
jgi:glycosyltransferase involved in cell wall biosynthesis